MPPEFGMDFNGYEIFIDGSKFEGIEDFKCDINEAAHNYVADNMKFNGGSFTFTCKVDKLALWKIMGMYDWVCKYCPNRRVAHLARYGKNRRVKYKNFLRGMKILGEFFG